MQAVQTKPNRHAGNAYAVQAHAGYAHVDHAHAGHAERFTIIQKNMDDSWSRRHREDCRPDPGLT